MKIEDMSTDELEKAADTHGATPFGNAYQVPTEYDARQRWLAMREEFKRRTGHDPRPDYMR